MTTGHHVAVIGAGYAGLAAAAELAVRGIRVSVFEASRALGGRARAVHRNGMTLDNGQHVLIGAYRETLRLMRLVGVSLDSALLRLPMTLVYGNGVALRAPKLPPPWHLLLALATCRGLAIGERLAAARFIADLRRRAFRLDHDMTVAELMVERRQPDRLRDYLWEPLCVAALNTPVADASAQVFANVLRDSLGANADASDLLLPRCNLSHLFPQAARTFIEKHGGRVITGTEIRNVCGTHEGFLLQGIRHRSHYSHVIAAVAPFQLEALTSELAELQQLRSHVRAFRYQPIVTCYLAYERAPRLPAVMVGMTNGITQWLFDRERLNGQPGVVSAVMSARGTHSDMNRGEIARRVHEEICMSFGQHPAPRWTQVINEKRATFSCVPGLARPDARTPLPNFYLCGDYVASDYPATLESAVRSGVRCATLVAESRAT